MEHVKRLLVGAGLIGLMTATLVTEVLAQACFVALVLGIAYGIGWAALDVYELYRWERERRAEG